MTDTVLVKKRWNSCSKVYHEPSEEDPNKPKCGYNKPGTVWRQKDPELFPNHSMCQRCSGDVNHRSPEKRPSEILAAMDPSEVSL